MKLPKLPIGQQDFRKLREEGAIYVDKTRLLHEMIDQASYNFISRPRRFGKSLLVSTMYHLFRGDKELFKGLWIEDKWNWEKKYPVIRIDFNQAKLTTNSLEDFLRESISIAAEECQIDVSIEDHAKGKFLLLLREIQKRGERAVILIDEYDKAIVDFLGNKETLDEHVQVLKSFYGTLKAMDGAIQFAFLTGVSKFAKVSIFSDLNNLLDLTNDRRYATIFGITQEEMEAYFDGYIEKAMQETKLTRLGLLDKIREHYNGYSWNSGKDKVYNPFSLLSFFSVLTFRNFWFATGTPTFLVKLIDERFLFNFKGILVGDFAFEASSIDHLEPASLLWQTGYLTITEEVAEGVFRLDFPNKEVENSMSQHLLANYAKKDVNSTLPTAMELCRALKENKIEDFFSMVNSLFADIPYHIFEANSEKFYHAIMHLTFTLMGYYIESERATAKGRTDMVFKSATHIYVFEYKVNDTAQAAIQQIKDKGYATPYLHAGKEVVLLGVSFDKESKGVKEWVREDLG